MTMIQAEYVADAYLQMKEGHTRPNIIKLIKKERRRALSTLLARCHQHPDAPSQTLIRFIHTLLQEVDV